MSWHAWFLVRHTYIRAIFIVVYALLVHNDEGDEHLSRLFVVALSSYHGYYGWVVASSGDIQDIGVGDLENAPVQHSRSFWWA
jgi:hypothetical protein